MSAEAVADYDLAIKLDPKSVLAYNGRGEAKNKLNRFAEAISDFSQAIALDPKLASAYQNRGFAYYKLGSTKLNYRKAIADYNIAVQLGGSDFKPTFNYQEIAVAALDKPTTKGQ
jgi:tetratricopeptide (TPR) repeat protein